MLKWWKKPVRPETGEPADGEPLATEPPPGDAATEMAPDADSPGAAEMEETAAAAAAAEVEAMPEYSAAAFTFGPEPGSHGEMAASAPAHEPGHAGANGTHAETRTAPRRRKRTRPQNKAPLGIVIAVGNQKGGVGKTTTTVHVAAALGLRGYDVLVIDLDPAAGATKHLGVDGNRFAGSLELLSGREKLDSVIMEDNLPEGVHLIPSRPQLSELDTLLSKFVDRMSILEGPLSAARKQYDFIFLDTAPVAAATTTVAAYAAAEWFLLSAFAHPLSLGGLSEAFSDIADVRAHRNRKLEVLGIVFTNVDTRAKNLRARVEAVIDEVMPGRKFHTWISQACVLPEASGRGITVFQMPKFETIKVARQYVDLSREIEQRVLNREAFLEGALPAVQCA